jgi:2-phospho-L-lactate/phosphoenolpyruvate guanylyltransferase
VPGGVEPGWQDHPVAVVERWDLVVPVKRLSRAKTRLVGPAAPHRADLALAFALDTVAAALQCGEVGDVVAVTDEPDAARHLSALGAVVVPDRPDAGLNPALRHGAETARAAHPHRGVGALSADLPALRPDELGRALARAADHDLVLVRDADSAGTTLLAAAPGRALEPQFGPGSAGLHAAAGAVDVTGTDLPGLRRDVDTVEDLLAAAALGLGPRSAAVAARFLVLV